jgi:hypothetical protein
VPCKISDLSVAMKSPVVCAQEYRGRPVACQQENL